MGTLTILLLVLAYAMSADANYCNGDQDSCADTLDQLWPFEFCAEAHLYEKKCCKSWEKYCEGANYCHGDQDSCAETLDQLWPFEFCAEAHLYEKKCCKSWEKYCKGANYCHGDQDSCAETLDQLWPFEFCAEAHLYEKKCCTSWEKYCKECTFTETNLTGVTKIYEASARTKQDCEDVCRAYTFSCKAYTIHNSGNTLYCYFYKSFETNIAGGVPGVIKQCQPTSDGNRCFLKGKVYETGHFYIDCNSCVCEHGHVACTDILCPSKESCELPSDHGSCRQANQRRWFYNSKKGDCEEFVYGGCGGNGNQFYSKEACMNMCASNGLE